MRKLLVLSLLTLCTLTVDAKSMVDIWKAIPDSLMPYVDRKHRTEMVEFIRMGLKGDVDNLLGSKSTMDSLTSNFIQVRASEAMMMQIKRLPRQGSDSILCVVRTWFGPVKSSRIQLYTENWKPIEQDALGNRSLDSMLPMFISRPEGMSEDKFNELKISFDFLLPYASLVSYADDLQLSVSNPLPSQERNIDFERVKKLIILKWNGNIFK
jgi:hypothetical protein